MLLSNSSAATANCPYKALSGNVLVALNAFCPSAGQVCVVTPTCAVLKDSTNYEYVGNFSNLSPSTTSLSFSSTGTNTVDLTYAVLPNSIRSLYFSAFDNFLTPPSNFSWPKNLTRMSYSYTKSQTYTPIIPEIVNDTAMSSDTISVPMHSTVNQLDLSEKTISAETINLPKQIPSTVKHLQLNAGSMISQMDCSGLRAITLGQATNSFGISNLKLNNSLVSMSFQYSVISSWIMDMQTFTAINRLQPRGNYSNSFPPTTTEGQLEGFYYTLPGKQGSALNISTSKSDCDLAGGQLQELQPYRQLASEVYGLNTTITETKMRFIVCVTNSATTASSISTGAIVGIVMAAIVLLAGIVFCVLRFKKRRTLKSMGDTYTQSETPRYYHGDDTQLRIHDLEMVKLNSKSLVLSTVLGSGAFANVWLGTYEGETVAVKKLHSSKVTQNQVQSFVQEISLMASFDSPYVVKFIGAAWTRPSDVQCVMEFMDGGDLREYLIQHSCHVLSWAEKYDRIHSIVQGLVYLHSLNVIHRDLKSRNVLLDSVKGTKLTDFGTSKEDVQATMTAGIGTYRWMAPEVIQDKDYSVSADIYSFGGFDCCVSDISVQGSVGCILSEFSTHDIPYSELKNPTNGQPVADSAIMVRVISGDLIPKFHDRCPTWLHELALECLAHEPDDRPTAPQIAYCIRTHLQRASIGGLV
ncbi:Aste57867_15966 [Aphanomyces stellatus]|uniref:Aste57867_15966 protein n=1 Tax=Aphanomyces stellatus TaxID=120398 RepID=A0A485L4C7_9STRA|nr:hypothetical protein As57867_015910 [Aphanomyces stellatus]VFT92751.1 Aste57867_15966 [Aphanomyces stellatus]